MTTPGVTPEDPTRSFVQLWAESMAAVLGRIVSAPFPLENLQVLETAPAPGDLYLTVTAAGAVRGEMSLRLGLSSALDLARISMGGADTGARELTADDRTAVEELFRQIAGQVSTLAQPRWPEIPLTVVLGGAPTWSPGAHGRIGSGQGAPRQLQIEWQLSSALTASLLAAWQEAEVASAPPSAQASPGPPDAAKFDLFINLELDVTLRFGGRNILLKEILELGAGSVLELDREIQDPADLVLDGKLIARGEVVVVNGNFGMRVTEVFTGQQIPA